MTVYILCVYISYMCKYELGQHYLLTVGDTANYDGQ